MHTSGQISDGDYESIHASSFSGDQLGRYRELLGEDGVMAGVSDRYQGIDSHWVPRGTDDPEGELSEFIENGNPPGGG